MGPVFWILLMVMWNLLTEVSLREKRKLIFWLLLCWVCCLFSLGSWLTIRIRILIWMGLNGPSYWRCRLIVHSSREKILWFLLLWHGSHWFGVLARICWFRIMSRKCESEYSFLIVFSRFLIEWSWFWLRTQVGIVSRSVRFIYRWVELPDD